MAICALRAAPGQCSNTALELNPPPDAEPPRCHRICSLFVTERMSSKLSTRFSARLKRPQSLGALAEQLGNTRAPAESIFPRRRAMRQLRRTTWHRIAEAVEGELARTATVARWNSRLSVRRTATLRRLRTHFGSWFNLMTHF